MIALVRLLRVSEAGELAHRPQTAAIHRRMDPARIRVLTRLPEIALQVERGNVLRTIELFERYVGDRTVGRTGTGSAAFEGLCPFDHFGHGCSWFRQTLTISFPKFSPRSIPINARGAFWSPSTTSSR